jgi:hypothetical protein
VKAFMRHDSCFLSSAMAAPMMTGTAISSGTRTRTHQVVQAQRLAEHAPADGEHVVAG